MAAKNLQDFAWLSTTASRYDEMLNVLPPAEWKSGMFLVGEAMSHDDDGSPYYTVYSRADGKYTVGSRPITVAEFNTLLGREASC